MNLTGVRSWLIPALIGIIALMVLIVIVRGLNSDSEVAPELPSLESSP